MSRKSFCLEFFLTESQAYEEEGKYTPERPEQRRSPRKLEKHPVFVLDITLPATSLDNCLEPAKMSVQIKACSDP